MEINYPDITFEGPAISDQNFLNALPEDLKSILKKKNGFIAFGGGFHLRGICDEPTWHSLELFWTGNHSFSKLYSSVQKDDVPFGQDCLGDQFLLRKNQVLRLRGESGEIVDMKMDFLTFLEEALSNPLEFLELSPLKKIQNEGKKLEPGQLINVYPPFITAESRKGVSLKPIPTLERILFLSNFAKQISNISNGTQIKFNVASND